MGGNWQPIETAPTDGTLIIGRGASGRPRLMVAKDLLPADKVAETIAQAIFDGGPMWWAYCVNEKGCSWTSFRPQEWMPNDGSLGKSEFPI